jgi:hypothetical protein
MLKYINLLAGLLRRMGLSALLPPFTFAAFAGEKFFAPTRAGTGACPYKPYTCFANIRTPCIFQ